MRAEDDAAMAVVRRGDRTLTGAAGAFLAVRLASAAGDFGAGFGVAGVLAAVGRLVDDRLMHQAGIDFCSKTAFR